MSTSSSEEDSQDDRDIEIASDFDMESDIESEQEQEELEDAGDSAESESNFYTCLVCMNTAQDPVVAFCGHMFCAQCIHKWMRSQLGSYAKCPYCQSIIGDNTLISVNTTAMSGYSGCQSIAEHRHFSNIIQHAVPAPEESMFIGGLVLHSPELMPRMKPLAPELLLEYFKAPCRLYFFDAPILQRSFMLIMLFYLFIATLRMDGTV
ncbi:E3 ubiquitin-protein ligase ORTHRUS-LIKE 1 [Drosophila innubila]|uniref:E3 ubiquitin-protein ligase ORTHRUS-LIKE 1 n=1 Tax=Drosophila innubila TaxID=198719 RepID=UPI00148BD6C0|nr:E3 ubiquitin-protein ligase ORTHRUS-LIKE 1 [Drosophila innubila]